MDAVACSMAGTVAFLVADSTAMPVVDFLPYCRMTAGRGMCVCIKAVVVVVVAMGVFAVALAVAAVVVAMALAVCASSRASTSTDAALADDMAQRGKEESYPSSPPRVIGGVTYDGDIDGHIVAMVVAAM